MLRWLMVGAGVGAAAALIYAAARERGPERTRRADDAAARPTSDAVRDSPATSLAGAAASSSWLTGWDGDALDPAARLSVLPMEAAIGFAQTVNGVAGALMGEALVQSARCCERGVEKLRLPAAPWSMADWWAFQNNVWLAVLDTEPAGLTK